MEKMKYFLLPFSMVFCIVVYIRNKMYNLGILKSSGFNTMLISVGNISSGGTGKTPMVEFLARYFLSKNKLVAIINKGYKRTYDDIQVAELGYENEERKLNIDNFGDESLMLLENFKGMTGGKGLLIVSDNKTTGAKFAYKKFKPDIMIIDDGFQHRKLYRDLDIVMVDRNTKSFMLPAGMLREPMKNLLRADIIVKNYKFGSDDFKLNKKLLYRTSECRYILDSFRNVKNEVLDKKNFRATIFCGLGDPDSFKILMDKMEISVDAFLPFPDHHDFTEKDINNIIETYQSCRSDCILTTQKDFVRLNYAKSDNSATYRAKMKLLSDYPLYYAKIKLQISENDKILLEKLNQLTKEQQKL